MGAFHLLVMTGEHLPDRMWALVVALTIVRLASRMTSMSFLDQSALVLYELSEVLRMLGKFMVDPRQVELRALIALVILAFVVALLDGGVILACLGGDCQGLGTLAMTVSIFAALVMTLAGLLEDVVHFLHSLMMSVVTVVAVAAMVTG